MESAQIQSSGKAALFKKTAPLQRLAMRQRRRNLLFLHWPVDPKVLRPHLPAGLEVDLFDNQPIAVEVARFFPSSLPSCADELGMPERGSCLLEPFGKGRRGRRSE
jgi:Uncharacterized conserved protein (COG2071)